MFVLDPHYKSLQFPTFLRVHPPLACAGVKLADTGSGRWKCWQLKGPIIHKKWIVITSIPGQYIDEAFANHG